jgi:hypothetical protein
VAEEDHSQVEQKALCGCLTAPDHFLTHNKELGTDDNFAQVTLLVCPVCGRQWLRYFYEIEAFTASGRWYMGAITAEQASILTADNAKATLEDLGWYFYGGSYYRGQNGKASGSILLNP